MRPANILVLLLSYVLLVGFYFYIDEDDTILQESDDPVLLELRNLSLKKGEGTIFSFNLQENDEIFVHCPSCESVQRRGDLAMKLTSKADKKSRSIEKKRLDHWVPILESGLHELELRGRKNTILDSIRIYIRPFFEDAWDTTSTFVKVDHVYLEAEKNASKQLRFIMPLEKEDDFRIVLTPNDDASLGELFVAFGELAKRKHERLTLDREGELRPTIKKDTLHAVNLFAKKKGMFSRQKGFYNIHIWKFVEEEEKTADSGGGGGGGGSGGGGGGGEAADAEEDQMAETMKQLQEAIKDLVPDPKDQLALLNRPGDDEGLIFVPARRDAFKRPRVCKAIESTPGAQLWVYWIGVGHDAIAAYTKRLENQLKNQRTLLNLYAKSRFIDNKSDLQVFPRGPFADDIQYAVLDSDNKELFEQGSPNWKPYFGGVGASTNFVSNDFGGLKRQIPDDDLYICLCNNNAYSGLWVYFIYEFYDIEKQEVQ